MKFLQLSVVLLVGIASTLAIPSPQQNDEAAPASKSRNVLDDPDRKSCHWTNDGSGTFFLDGKNDWQYYLYDWELFWDSDGGNTPYDRIRWNVNDMEKPPRDWDGSEATLGYPMPEKGTQQYKNLLCWPDLPQKTLGATDPAEWNIKKDADRKGCFTKGGWSNEYGRNVMHLWLSGGFPHIYEEVGRQEGDKYVLTVNSSPEYQRPTQDWDGRKETLGFPVPQKGTTHYNMLLCWPYDIRQN